MCGVAHSWTSARVLIAPLSITLVGVTGTMGVIATAVVAYGTLVLSHSEHPKRPAIADLRAV